MGYSPDWSQDTIRAIESMITKDMTVYEWGTGFSTIWLAQRVSELVTMEHNSYWYEKISGIAKELGLKNIQFELATLFQEKYYKQIHDVNGIGLIIIDGRNRVRCFNEAVKVGAPIMLDDSERERYSEVFNHGLRFIDTLPTSQGQKATIFNV